MSGLTISNIKDGQNLVSKITDELAKLQSLTNQQRDIASNIIAALKEYNESLSRQIRNLS